MKINPFNIQVEEMETAKAAATQRIPELSLQLDWYRGFVPEATHARYLALGRSLSTTTELQAKMRERLQHLRATQRATEEQARIKLDPRSLFSPERTIAKRKVLELGSQITQLEIEITMLTTPKSEAGEDIRALATALHQELKAYHSFDVLQAQSEIAMRQDELAHLEPELARARLRKLTLDRELAEPWKNLQTRLAQQALIECDVRKAEQFSSALGTANGNRAAIHEACERELGDGSPGRVKSNLKRKLEFEKREIAKLEKRIAEAVRKSQLDVREVIIDGSNMAHHGAEFIGLRALEAVMPSLAARYEVTINFDPGFPRKVGLSSAEIRERLPHARVYFLPRGMSADPYVLKFVEGKPHAYVISNDNFRDYGEKEGVRQRKILPHAVLNNMAAIPDLDIEASLL
ncbi:hypothetical protein [Janthinobacterium sp. 78]|uniref:hypothetical protein n=1 Tax=Janthinobacterium sp. 78 TaxID=2135631 RepID=UPI000D5D144D|nr:hypothetical protein [Janthinobacterium sp. 78]PVX38178.1 hypothetical protein C8C92_4847 [Janthinobacterium sp. 78]